MSTLRELPVDTLTNDVTFAALMTGGVFDAQDMPIDGGGASSAPRETDGVQIKPHAIVRWRSDKPFSAVPIGAENTSFEVYLYQHVGYDIIEQAITLAKALFHQKRFQSSDRQFVFINWVFNGEEMTTAEYNGHPMRFMRFEVTQVR